MAAKDRPFTRLGAALLGGEALTHLDAGRCPTCGGPIGPFKDELSKKEFTISGMCQDCQDKVFDEHPVDPTSPAADPEIDRWLDDGGSEPTDVE